VAQERGARKFLDYLKQTVSERLDPATIGKEVMQTLTDKVVPQGATELAQGLYSGHSNAFTPYGHAQQPLEVEGPAAGYQAMLQEAAQRVGPQQERDVGVER
jgi:hypothetical protein